MNIRNTMKSIATALIAASFALALVGEASAQNVRCDREAKRFANGDTNPGGEIVGGTVLGAIGGAVLGGLFGGGRGARRGAFIGGGLGLFSGAVRGSHDWNDAYDYAYDRCMGYDG